MKPSKSGKSYKVFSDNPKMDTSGMAGKPKVMEMAYEWKPPAMRIEDIMEAQEKKDNKRPEVEMSNMRCQHTYY